MTIQIELNAEMEAKLSAAACLRGMELQSYAQRLLQEAIVVQSTRHPRASQEEFRTFLESLGSNTPDASHLHTETFSREMIYGEHD